MAQSNSIENENVHVVIEDDLFEAKSNAIGRAWSAFFPVGTSVGLTNGMTPTQKGPIVSKGWQQRYLQSANTNEGYYYNSLTQKQIRNAATVGAVAEIKAKLIIAGISTNKFMVIRNKTVDWVDAYALSRGLIMNPALFTQ